MVLANAKDGSTGCFDLRSPDQCRKLAAMLRADLVTGLSIHFDGSVVSLPAPRRFKRRSFGFELVGQGIERIFCQSDGVRVSLTHSLGSTHVRCDLVRTGDQRYNPAA